MFLSIRVISFCLIFLCKLKFKTIDDVYDYIKNKYGQDHFKLLLKISNISRKLRKSELDGEFLVKCKTYNVFPKFLRFKLYKKSLENSNFYRAWQSKLLCKEIAFKKEATKRLSSELRILYHNLCFSKLDVLIVRRFVAEEVQKFSINTSRIHSRKLSYLGINNSLAP